MFGKKKESFEKAMEVEALVWETDQHLLSWNVAGEHRLSLGYATHSLEDYQGLVPVVLDVMDELLKDCTVFTWLKTPLLQVSSTKKFWFRRNAPKRALPNLAAQYASVGGLRHFLSRLSRGTQCFHKPRSGIGSRCNGAHSAGV
ncbi:hypothetical protein [Oscillibacter sp.]|uniref:hypothetical protein n=1 Tax=Oscillibacter sp. TaxID=1945593 RepID=UPI00289AD0DE|nr:hypothetical protein [Oscillibacter sp.]